MQKIPFKMTTDQENNLRLLLNFNLGYRFFH